MKCTLYRLMFFFVFFFNLLYYVVKLITIRYRAFLHRVYTLEMCMTIIRTTNHMNRKTESRTEKNR